MRAVTWTQVAQYIVLIIAYLIPVIWMSNAQGFGIIPHFGYGEAVARIQELEPAVQLGAAAVDKPPFGGVKDSVGSSLRPAGWYAELEFCDAGDLYDDGYGIVAAYPDALLYDAFCS